MQAVKKYKKRSHIKFGECGGGICGVELEDGKC